MKKVFVSYKRSDKAQVVAMIDDLKASRKVEVWFDDNLLGGQLWWDEILSHIRQSDVVIAAVSGEMLKSVPCALEQQYAIDLGKTLLPVRIDPEMSKALPANLSVRQIIPYSGQKREYDPLLKAILDAPTTVMPAPLPKPPAVPMDNLPAVRQLFLKPMLDANEQWRIYQDLERNLAEQPKNSAEILPLLRQLRDRPEMVAHVQKEVDALLSSAQPKAAPAAPNRRFLIIGVIIVLVALVATIALASRASSSAVTPTPQTVATATAVMVLNATVTKVAEESGAQAVVPTALMPSGPTTASPATPGEMHMTLIYEGMDAFTLVLSGAIDLSKLELKSSSASAFPAADFPAVSEAPASISAGGCLRYVRTNAKPPLPQDCASMPVFSLSLADANVFWWDANSNRLLDLAVKRGSDVLRICPAAAVRCKVL